MLTLLTKKNFWRWAPVNLVGLAMVVGGIAGFSHHLFKLNSRSWSSARHSFEFSVAGAPNFVPMVVGGVVVLAGLGLAIMNVLTPRSPALGKPPGPSSRTVRQSRLPRIFRVEQLYSSSDDFQEGFRVSGGGR